MYGLQGMFTTADGQDLGLQLLRSFIKLHEEAVADDYSLEYISCGRSVVMTLPFLRDHLTESEVKECEKILTDIESKTRVSDFDEEGDPTDARGHDSNADFHISRMHSATKKALGESYISRSHNEHLFGLFKCGVVVRMPRAVNARTGEKDQMRGSETERGGGPDESLIINIEFDGVHHLRENKKRFCRLRDEYLQSRGVVVGRTMKSTDYQDLIKWMTEVAAKAPHL